MSNRTIATDRIALRLRATSRLSGVAGLKGARVSAADALAVLHDLASSPATAADALALLHELQVHQVELDLQAEELRESRLALESALRRQIELYDFQPVGCLTIDRGLVVHELNLAAASLLGVGRDEAYGLLLDSFLCADSARKLRELIAGVSRGRVGETSMLRLTPKGGTGCAVWAHINADPAGPRCLIVLAKAADG
jgi:PAS domain-containing protein